jgi:DNA primase
MDWDRAHAYTRGIAERLAATAPDRYIMTATLEARPERLFTTISAMGGGQRRLAPFRRARVPAFQSRHPSLGIRSGASPT